MGKLGFPQRTCWVRRGEGAGRKVGVPHPSGSQSRGSSGREGRGRRSPGGRAQGRCLPEHAQGRGLALPMRSRCGPSEARGRAGALPPRWQLREPGSGAAGAAAAKLPARRALRPGPRGGNHAESWKLSWQVTLAARTPPPVPRESSAGSVAGAGGEGRVPESSPGNESEAGGKVSGRFLLLLRRAQRELSGNRRGHAGAPGLGLGDAGESVQAVSCAPGGAGCSRAGLGGTLGSRGAQDFPSRPLPASSVAWLDRAWAAPGTWVSGADARAGRLAPRGLECRRARVAKFPSELQRGKSYRPL